MNSCDHLLMDMFVISTKVNANRFKFCLSLSEMESLIPIWINSYGGIQHLNTIEVHQPCNKFLHIGSSLNMYNRQSRRKTPKNIFHYSICSWKKKWWSFQLHLSWFCLLLFQVYLHCFGSLFILCISFILLLLEKNEWMNDAGKVNGSNCHYVETIGGGCPDGNLCHETCRPCYVGIGLILTYCVAPGGGINYWRCRCSFMKGAPCRLPGIACPAPVSPSSSSSSSSQSQHLLQDGYGNKTAWSSL